MNEGPFPSAASNNPIIILLQNNTEIRPTGGFLGSYAKLSIINHQLSISFHDIYVPDGQLSGHVDPPEPIQIAFGQGWYKLRDANFETDFPTAANSIRWFFTKGNENNPNILIALNLSTIQKIIKFIQPIHVNEYNIDITDSNIYSILQTQTELNFFPGSTQKRDALSSTGKAILKKLDSLDLKQKINLAYQILTDLDSSEILINSANPQLQQLIQQKHWAGELKPLSVDTVAMIETNLGANKANCCILRHTTHTIKRQTSSPDKIIHQVQTNFTNSSPLPNPNPPHFYGGNYINFLRLYVPSNAQNIQIQTTPIPDTKDFKRFKTLEKPKIKLRYGLTEISFFHITLFNSNSQVNVSYELTLPENTPYQLSILKQPGIIKSPQKINLLDQILTTNLSQNFTSKTNPTN